MSLTHRMCRDVEPKEAVSMHQNKSSSAVLKDNFCNRKDTGVITADLVDLFLSHA